jgi:hypothetical protein
MTSITYEKYNERSFAVRGDKNKYSEEMKRIGGRWNTRLKGGDGWTVPIENETLLKNIMERDMPKKQFQNGNDCRGRGGGRGRGRGRPCGRGKVIENVNIDNNVRDDDKNDDKDDDEEISPDVQKKSQAILELLDATYKNKSKKHSSQQNTPPRQMIREKNSPSRLRDDSDSNSNDDSYSDVDEKQKHRQPQQKYPDHFHGSKELRRSRDYTPPKKYEEHSRGRKEHSREHEEHSHRGHEELSHRGREELSRGHEKYSHRGREEQPRRNISPERKGYVSERRKESPIRRETPPKGRKLFDELPKRNQEKELTKKSNDVLACYTDFGRKPIDFRRIQATMNETNSESESDSSSNEDSESSSSSSSSSSSPPQRNFNRQDPEKRFHRR